MDFTEIRLSGKTRREHDLLGEMEIPAEYYFGVQTMRAVENFHISRVRLNFFPQLIRALADVKQGAAMANRDLGLLDGEKLIVGLGKYGPYVRYGKSFASLARTDDPYTITYERAVELVREHKAAAAAAHTPLRTFPEDPDMLVKNGRYGAYIAYKGKNYRLPRGTKPETLTLDDCLKIVSESKK